MRVLAVDADALHADQPFSTHVLQIAGMDLLDELGVGEAVRAVAPPVRTTRLSVSGHAYDLSMRASRNMYCPRRSTLDPLLQDAALAAGVEIRDKTRVRGLLRSGDAVCGVEVEHAGGRYEIRAPWVIGADGRNSTVARLLSVPSYISHESERGGYWAYWPKPRCWDHDEPYRRFQTLISIDPVLRFVFECDGELLVIGAIAARDVARTWGTSYADELHRELRASPMTEPLVEGAPIAPPVGLLKGNFFFRPAVGQGWALVGDAGLHKDPTPGHGITDALRDAKGLARALLDGRPEALELYWRERDVASVPLYYQALSMGSLSYVNPLNTLIMDRLNGAGPEQDERMRDVFERKRSPFDAVPRARMLRWFGAGLVRRRKADLVLAFAAAARFGAMADAELAKRKRLLAAAERALHATARPEIAA
jgi:flavin-dependent dehydrogenase